MASPCLDRRPRGPGPPKCMYTSVDSPSPYCYSYNAQQELKHPVLSLRPSIDIVSAAPATGLSQGPVVLCSISVKRPAVRHGSLPNLRAKATDIIRSLTINPVTTIPPRWPAGGVAAGRTPVVSHSDSHLCVTLPSLPFRAVSLLNFLISWGHQVWCPAVGRPRAGKTKTSRLQLPAAAWAERQLH